MYNRFFQLWYYTVSHKQMLLRSLGNKDVCNLDIYFGDVEYIELPVTINKIKLLETTQQDIDYITQRIGNMNKKITVLECENSKYYVVSSFMKIIENNLGMFELPFDIANDMSGEYYKPSL